jgi:hypothetical protein
MSAGVVIRSGVGLSTHQMGDVSGNGSALELFLPAKELARSALTGAQLLLPAPLLCSYAYA